MAFLEHGPKSQKRLDTAITRITQTQANQNMLATTRLPKKKVVGGVAPHGVFNIIVKLNHV